MAGIFTSDLLITHRQSYHLFESLILSPAHPNRKKTVLFVVYCQSGSYSEFDLSDLVISSDKIIST